jgi:lipopolysaccharide transport system permease protein
MKFQNHIVTNDSFFNLRLKDIWQYRDLLFLFVRRDFVAKFKQTLLGPSWFLIQPLFTAITYTFIFGNVAALPTDGIPPSLFYLSGITAWSYFAGCLKTTSSTFTKNSGLFGKVYFPRAVTPISVAISNLIQFAIQFLLFLLLYFFYLWQGADLKANISLLLFPILVLTMGLMGLGSGMLISSLTTKYRDLQNLVNFGTQLLMYASPVIIPYSELSAKASEKGLTWIININPMNGIVETFRYSFLSKGELNWNLLIYSFGFATFIFLIGLLVFNRTEKNFMDTV